MPHVPQRTTEKNLNLGKTTVPVKTIFFTTEFTEDTEKT
jgi:hypothetical protein